MPDIDRYALRLDGKVMLRAAGHGGIPRQR
jgi:hypothetical protein